MNAWLTKHPHSLMEHFFADSVRRPVDQDSLKIEVKKNDAEYRVLAHLPGAKKEDLTVEIKDGVLNIGAKIEKSANTEYETVYSELSGRSEFKRALKIDSSRFDTEKVQAKIEHGVLEVVLPVKPEEQPQQIQVN